MVHPLLLFLEDNPLKRNGRCNDLQLFCKNIFFSLRHPPSYLNKQQPGGNPRTDDVGSYPGKKPTFW